MPRPASAFFLATSALVAQAPAPAEDAWEAMVEARRRASMGDPTWRIYLTPTWLEAFRNAALLRPHRASGDLLPAPLEGEALQSLRRRLGWSLEVGWALVDPQGRMVRSGTEPPDPGQVLTVMRDLGWRPRMEVRAAFLREHPDHGDAWEDELREACREALFMTLPIRMRLYQRVPPLSPEAREQAVTAEAAREPGAERLWARIAALLWSLDMAGSARLPPIAAELSAWRERVFEALAGDPANPELWAALEPFIEARWVEDLETRLMGLAAAPGTPWPVRDLGAALDLDLVYRSDAAGRLARAERGLTEGPSREAALRTWAPIKLRALLALQRDEAALAWIREARAQAPAIWTGRALRALESALEEEPDRLQAVKRTLASSPEPPETAPLPLRFLALEAEARRVDALRVHPTLDPWAPGELQFAAATPAQRARYRERWPEAGWLLLRGEEVLDQGAGLPSPEALRDRLLAQGVPPPLQLEHFLKAHPDHTQAREELRDRLSARMPHPRLELRLVQICEALGEAPILRSPFQPQRPLWEGAARRALAAAEARLTRWPEEAWAWAAWMDWASVHPAAPSPLQVYASLPLWKSRRKGGEGPLPLEVVGVVAAGLERQARWKELEAWARLQWEGGWARALARLERTQPEPELEAARQSGREQLTKALLRPWLTSLGQLGRTAEASALRQELRGYEAFLREPSPDKGKRP